MKLKGWNVTDQSYLARGADPTWVGEFRLTKQGWTLTVTEFQLVYSIQNGRHVTRGLNEREASDQLRSYGAPSVAEISEACLKEEQKQSKIYFNDDEV